MLKDSHPLIFFFFSPVRSATAQSHGGHWPVVTYGQQKPFPGWYNAHARIVLLHAICEAYLNRTSRACTPAATFCARWHINKSKVTVMHRSRTALHKKSTWHNLHKGAICFSHLDFISLCTRHMESCPFSQHTFQCVFLFHNFASQCTIHSGKFDELILLGMSRSYHGRLGQS
jgi:hypothetical protein